MQEGWANFDPAFSAFEDACGNDTGLPSDLTSTTASATGSHQQDDVNAMSTSISNGLGKQANTWSKKITQRSEDPKTDIGILSHYIQNGYSLLYLL